MVDTLYDDLKIAEEIASAPSKPKNNKSVRFSDAPWYRPGIECTVGGAGGIGSWLAFFLGRQECSIALFDMDNIDETNLGGQLYSLEDIGQNKAEVVARKIKNYSGNDSIQVFGEYSKDSLMDNIAFSAFDNMKARALMFENWAKNPDREIFIDGRMLAEIGQIYCCIKGKEDEYRKTLFADSESAPEMCSYKATSHCGAIIAGLMVSAFNNYIGNIKLEGNLREVPFKLEYELPLLTFSVQSYV